MTKPATPKRTNKDRDKEIRELQARLDMLNSQIIGGLDRAITSLYLSLGKDMSDTVKEQEEAYNTLVEEKRAQFHKTIGEDAKEEQEDAEDSTSS